MPPATTDNLPAGEIGRLRGAVREWREAGWRCDPTDHTSWPDEPYSRLVNGKTVPMSRQEFVNVYGHISAPTLPAAMPPRPAPTKAQSSAEVETTGSGLDLTTLLGSRTKEEAPSPSPTPEVEAATEPSPPAVPPQEEPPSSDAPVVVNENGDVVDRPDDA